MIKTFSDRSTALLFETGSARGIATDLAARAQKRLDQLDAATSLDDMRFPPGNKLRKLEGGDRWAIRVDRQWRITFEWSSGDAYEVKFEDYH